MLDWPRSEARKVQGGVYFQMAKPRANVCHDTCKGDGVRTGLLDRRGRGDAVAVGQAVMFY